MFIADLMSSSYLQFNNVIQELTNLSCPNFMNKAVLYSAQCYFPDFAYGAFMQNSDVYPQFIGGGCTATDHYKGSLVC